MKEDTDTLGRTFWDRVRCAKAPVLGLDYDGTLAPFHVDPLKAHPLPGIPGLLRNIVGLTPTRVILVSGRPIKELQAMIHVQGTYIGSHGMEIESEKGKAIQQPIGPDQAEGIQRALSFVRQKMERSRVEDKGTSVALHVRGKDKQMADRILEQTRKTWAGLAERYNLEVLTFNGGIELRTPGRHKGTTLLECVHTMDPPPDLIVYIGDDLTDEDVFTHLPPEGFGIKVARDNRPTGAHATIEDCRAVRSLLQTWLNTTRREQASNKHGHCR
ncbi:trehalose-phosphatase [Desulfoplanes sp.]